MGITQTAQHDHDMDQALGVVGGIDPQFANSRTDCLHKPHLPLAWHRLDEVVRRLVYDASNLDDIAHGKRKFQTHQLGVERRKCVNRQLLRC